MSDTPAVEAIRRVYEAWNTGDVSAFADRLDRDIAWRTLDFDGQEKTFVGRDEVRRFHERLIERTGWTTFEPQELIQVGDRVVAPLVSRTPDDAERSTSTSVHLIAMWTVHDGTPVAFRLFFDKDRALAAAER
jgi:ketosteroid isomerase-like protein